MPGTFDRLPAHTSEEINQQVQDDIRRRVRHRAAYPDAVARRLQELREEALRGDFDAVSTRQDKPGAALAAVGL